MNLILGFGLLGALIAVVVLFARLFGPAIAKTASRAASGDATGADEMATLAVIGAMGCDAGGGCD